jgi:predicted nucleotidyltransferase
MDRNELITRLKSTEAELRAFGVDHLYLFGSFARGEAKPSSDVDVFVEAADKRFYELPHFVGAYEILRAACEGHEIGYGTRDGLSPYIRPRVEAEAVRIF